MARKADVAALEARRFARGESQAAVARALDVTPMTACRWYQIWARNGAPELNPVEPLWGNVKTRELANRCAPDLAALGRPLRAGLGRVRRHPTLARSFLRHAGLTL